ncbi:MAG TPA: hypothetical protein VFL54_10390 [Gammaproteobacteria bacterium]|nr:hypothetical protein [Gammaproteobacteria bacterium]
MTGRFLLAAVVAVAIAACAAPTTRAKRPPPPERPAAADAGPPPNVSDCREFADGMAGRQMERDFDSISGNFEGGSSRVFQDFARLDAQRYRRQLYESCLSQQRASQPEPAAR